MSSSSQYSTQDSTRHSNQVSTQNSTQDSISQTLSILFRRVAAFFYDVLLLLSTLLISSLFILFLTKGNPVPPQNPYYQVFLFFVIFAFFVGFLSFGGQTTGMRAWRLQVVTQKEDKTPSVLRASLRFFLALITQGCGGLGWFWILLDPDKQTLYDRLSGTKMIMVKKVGLLERS